MVDINDIKKALSLDNESYTEDTMTLLGFKILHYDCDDNYLWFEKDNLLVYFKRKTKKFTCYQKTRTVSTDDVSKQEGVTE